MSTKPHYFWKGGKVITAELQEDPYERFPWSQVRDLGLLSYACVSRNRRGNWEACRYLLIGRKPGMDWLDFNKLPRAFRLSLLVLEA